MSTGSTSETVRLLDSIRERKTLAYVDSTITPTQLAKLKLLACIVLSTGEVKDADCVTTIYERLKVHFGGDIQTAIAYIYTMLETAGVNLQGNKQLSKHVKTSSALLADPKFRWRQRLIRYLDRATRENKEAILTKHVYRSWEIDMHTETVTSESLVALFDHMIANGKIQPGQEEVFIVIEKAFSIGKRQSCIMALLAILVVICFISAVGFSVPIWRYLSSDNDINYPSREVFYKEPVTLLPVKPFDLRYHDRAGFTVHRANSFNFKVDLCQAECGAGRNYESLITEESMVSSHSIESGSSRIKEYLFKDTCSIFVVRGSSISLSFTTEGNPTITLHMFNDTSQCSGFTSNGESADDMPYKSVNLTSSPYNFTAGSQEGEYLCLLLELPPNATLTYTVNAQIRHYRNVSTLIASDLCSANHSYSFDDGKKNKAYPIEFVMSRVPLDSVSPKYQETCFLLTLALGNTCSHYCQFNVTSTLYASANNVKVIFLSVLTVIALLIACSIIGIIRFLCYKYR